jgi:hypothetical protein
MTTGVKTMQNDRMAAARAAKVANGVKHARKKSSARELTAEEKKDLQRVSDYLPSALKVFSQAYSGFSKASAIKAKCIECCNLDKAEVSRCNISGCPLWRYRPYQREAK